MEEFYLEDIAPALHTLARFDPPFLSGADSTILSPLVASPASQPLKRVKSFSSATELGLVNLVRGSTWLRMGYGMAYISLSNHVSKAFF